MLVASGTEKEGFERGKTYEAGYPSRSPCDGPERQDYTVEITRGLWLRGLFIERCASRFDVR